MENLKIGVALCGSFCTFSKIIPVLDDLVKREMKVMPIMSHNAYSTDTRFGMASDFVAAIEEMTGQRVIHTIAGAEPIGPNRLLDALIIAPCTGNTLAKLAAGIADTSVTLAAKAHLRNNRPLIIAVSTNDGLSTASRNIAQLQNAKNIYFVPYQQDDSQGKPNSLVAHFGMIPETLQAAMKGTQLQPLLAPLY